MRTHTFLCKFWGSRAAAAAAAAVAVATYYAGNMECGGLRGIMDHKWDFYRSYEIIAKEFLCLPVRVCVHVCEYDC